MKKDLPRRGEFDDIATSSTQCRDYEEPAITWETNENLIGQVGMTSLQVNCSLAEVNASVFIAVF